MEIQNLPWYGQFLIFLLIFALVIGVTYYFLIYTGKQDQIKSLSDQLESVEQEIAKAERKKNLLPQLRQDKLEKEAQLEKLKEVLPEEKEISQILKKIESLVSSSRLRINSMTQNAPASERYYMRHPYAIRVEGNYHNLGIFLDQLSRLKKIFTVDNIVLAPITNMTREFNISATFVASTYTYQEKSAVAAPKTVRRASRRTESSDDMTQF